MKHKLLFTLAFALALAGPGRVQAEESASDHNLLSVTASHEAHHRHHVGLFFGGITRFEDAHEESGAALGLEYEYRFASRWGIGGLIEGVVVGEGHDLSLVVPVSWHPWRELKLSAGPGAEFNGHEHEFLGRVAAGYDFKIGRFTLAPEVAGDFTRKSQSIVYGLTLGCGF
jgi:hypothetical protein